MGIELLIPLLLLLPLLLITMRTRRQQREMAQMQQRLTPGQEVMTTSGVFGTVRGVDGDRVSVEVAPGVTTQWARQAIARILTPPSPGDSPDAGSSPDAGTSPGR